MALPQLIFGGINLVSFGISFLTFFAIYFALSLTLNLEAGLTGIPNFGKVLFVAGGAAVSGSVSGRLAAYVCYQAAPAICTQKGDYITFNPNIISQANAFLASDTVFLIELALISLLVAALIGAVFGYLASFPAIRLREDYLGMFLLVSAQFFQIFLTAFGPLVGGTQGIFSPDPFYYFTNPTFGAGYRNLAAAVALGVFALLVFVYCERVARSPLGRMLKSIRDNEAAARALGKDDVAGRRNVLIIASAIAGMAGAMVTFQTGAVGADTWTRFDWTFVPWLIIIIGGMGNNKGVALGTLFYTAVNNGLEQVQPYFQPYVPFDVNWLKYLLLAALLVGILLARPEGIVREKPAPTLSKRTLREISASSMQNGGKTASGDSADSAPSKSRRLIGRFRKRKASDAGPPP